MRSRRTQVSRWNSAKWRTQWRSVAARCGLSRARTRALRWRAAARALSRLPVSAPSAKPTGCPGSGVSGSPRPHLCARLFLASARWSARGADPKDAARLLGAEAAQESGTRRPEPAAPPGNGLAYPRNLGVRDCGSVPPRQEAAQLPIDPAHLCAHATKQSRRQIPRLVRRLASTVLGAPSEKEWYEGHR